jgi:hypothetical protein
LADSSGHPDTVCPLATRGGGLTNYYGNKFGYRYVCPACLAMDPPPSDPFAVWLDDKFKPAVDTESGDVRDDLPWTRSFKNKKTDMRLHYKAKHGEVADYDYPMGFIEIKRIEERKYRRGKLGSSTDSVAATTATTAAAPPVATTATAAVTTTTVATTTVPDAATIEAAAVEDKTASL